MTAKMINKHIYIYEHTHKHKHKLKHKHKCIFPWIELSDKFWESIKNRLLIILFGNNNYTLCVLSVLYFNIYIYINGNRNMSSGDVHCSFRFHQVEPYIAPHGLGYNLSKYITTFKYFNNFYENTELRVYIIYTNKTMIREIVHICITAKNTMIEHILATCYNMRTEIYNCHTEHMYYNVHIIYAWSLWSPHVWTIWFSFTLHPHDAWSPEHNWILPCPRNRYTNTHTHLHTHTRVM